MGFCKSGIELCKTQSNFWRSQKRFYDENAVLIADPDHSTLDEDRFIILGLSSEMHMLLVCHCHRENDRIRIISARKADLQESKQYGGK